jgi:DMSO reductase anchor subunit
MTKCDFCFDQLEQGLPPACVAACPMRVLDYGEAENAQGVALWDVPSNEHPFPMPEFSHTQPRLAIQPHAAMNNVLEKSIANFEEVQPRTPSSWEEAPLILFTLLGQLAVGGFWAMSWIFPPLWTLVERGTILLWLIPQLVIGISLGVGMLASFAHLGTKKNAWRVLTHLRRSWLSKEILFAGLFGLGWLVTAFEEAFLHRNTYELTAITAIFGIGLVYSMGQVYRIPAAPSWNTWRTNAGFLVSALLLGVSAMASLLTYESRMTGIQLPIFQWTIIGCFTMMFLFAQLVLMVKRPSDRIYYNTRVGLILFGIVLTVISLLPSTRADWQGILIFLIVAIEEGLGRWLFYRSRV